MWPDHLTQDVARLIQLAIAPVFLLTAVSATLSVLATRIGRVVDRGRDIEQLPTTTALVLERNRELGILERRARFIYWAMTLATLAAIQVSLLIAFAFVGYVFNFPIAWVGAILFMGAMFAYTGALLCLLREVTLAIANFRLGIAHETAHP